MGGAATLGEVLSVTSYEEYDHDAETTVSGLDYTIRFLDTAGLVRETTLRRSKKRLAAVGDEDLEPLLHLPGMKLEDILLVDEMGPIAVLADGGLTIRSPRFLSTFAVIGLIVWVLAAFVIPL